MNAALEQLDPAAAGPSSGRARPEVRIAFLYVLLASLWIIGSDTLVASVTDNGTGTISLQLFKGLGFVFATGALLYLALRRSFGGWRRAECERIEEISASRMLFRNLSQRIRSLREEEGTRISREIHDELGQRLTGLKLKLRLVEDHLEQRDDRSLNPLIDDLVEASAMVDETIDAVRRIASGLRPSALDDLGLASALNEEAERFSRQTGIACSLDVSGIDAPLPPAVQTAAFRIFQESLTNVARHAEASRVLASCGSEDDSLVLRIRDDGVGLDPSLAHRPASLGLLGMLERASDVGGHLTFRTRPEGGTEVELRVPVAAQPASASVPAAAP